MVIWLRRNRKLLWLWLAQQFVFVWTLYAVWLNWGPGHPAVPLIVIAWTFTLAPGLAVPTLRLLPPSWSQVPAGEHMLHQKLGVGIFERLVGRIGYRRGNIEPLRGGPITNARLSFRALAARAGSGAHAVCFTIHVLLTIAALLGGRPWGALWILLLGVIVHLYPALLQRSVMLRLQPLLDSRPQPAVPEVQRSVP